MIERGECLCREDVSADLEFLPKLKVVDVQLSRIAYNLQLSEVRLNP